MEAIASSSTGIMAGRTERWTEGVGVDPVHGRGGLEPLLADDKDELDSDDFFDDEDDDLFDDEEDFDDEDFDDEFDDDDELDDDFDDEDDEEI